MNRKQRLQYNLGPAMTTAMGIFLWIQTAQADRFFNGSDLLALIMVVGGIVWHMVGNYKHNKKESK